MDGSSSIFIFGVVNIYSDSRSQDASEYCHPLINCCYYTGERQSGLKSYMRKSYEIKLTLAIFSKNPNLPFFNRKVTCQVSTQRYRQHAYYRFVLNKTNLMDVLID